jgi:peptidoglycan/LPS O-acetylase OafA/YrhL
MQTAMPMIASRTREAIKSKDIPALTSVRFVAAAVVLLFHYVRFPVTGAPSSIQHIIQSGNAGVTFFFALSGFILVYVWHTKDLSDAKQRREFWIRRFARIYPVYALAAVLFGAARLWGAFLHIDGLTVRFVVKSAIVYGGLSLALVQAWIPHAAERWNWPGWSLSAEAFFYFLFPLLLVTFTRRAGVKSLFASLCAAVVVNAFCVQMCVLFAGTIVFPGRALQSDLGDYFATSPAPTVAVFVMGAAAGAIWCRGFKLKYAALAAWVSSALVFATLGFSPTATFGGISRNVLLAPEFCAVIYALACIPTRVPGPVGSAAVLLGRASYAFYILQFPVWQLCLNAWRPSERETQSVGYLVTFALLLTVISLVVYQFLERPAERWVRVTLGSPGGHRVDLGG